MTIYATTTGVTQFDPRLHTPIQVGSRIVANQYGELLRSGGSDGGAIDFALGRGRLGNYVTVSDPEMWAWLARHWKGREVRIFIGEEGDVYEDFTLVYTGRVDDLAHDTIRASVKIADASIDLDDVLVEDLYPDDDTVPEAIRGRPKPELRGVGNNIAPVLLSVVAEGATSLSAPLTYQVSRRALDAITEVRVGGIAWTEVSSDPAAGEWSADLANGKFTLGGITLGGEVTCDARSSDYATLTTGQLFSDLVTEAGGEVDADAITALDAAAPYLVDWYTSTEPVNRLDAFDQIMSGIVGYWGVTAGAKFTAGVLAAPSTTAALELTTTEIVGLRLIGLLPPAWRIRIEHSRIQSVQTGFFDSVSEADKQRWGETGKLAPAFEDETILTTEPRAVDLPIIRSLVRNETDAVSIRDRAETLFSTARRMYEIKARCTAPDLYATASVDYMMVDGNFRVHSVVHSFGGGPITLQVWG